MKNNDVLKIIGKVDAVNQGLTFYNTTVFDENRKTVNIKLREGIDKVTLGQIYEFTVTREPNERKEDEYILMANEIKEIEEVLDVDEITRLYRIFYDYAPITLEKLKNEIEGYLNKVENKVLFDITKSIYEEYKNKFYIHPAATKFHHTYIGGLAFHTLNMLKMAEDMLKIYTYMSSDLLYSGIILHDICKTLEITGVDGEYTNEGLLLGHIVMGVSKIDEVSNKFGYQKEEEVLLLKHMIVSHHGQMAFGSPKHPQIAEALLLWYIDTIDSKFQVIGEVLHDTVDGVFTPGIPVADKGRFLKHKLTK
ncbi:MAG TPA: HD domain-containing protein [Acholeplasmataceae bacterium]|jgi:3'-5' exoribonuclease|nr:HD domain-containing protein [Acholeplasmataceae bacterium]